MKECDYLDFEFSAWVEYYKNNQSTVDKWEESYRLSEDEYQTIYKSIQQFQIGESSEGKYLIHAAKKYIQKTKSDDSYLSALILFIGTFEDYGYTDCCHCRNDLWMKIKIVNDILVSVDTDLWHDPYREISEDLQGGESQ